MKGVILAAGYGSRLTSTKKSGQKSLVELAGLSFIERVLLSFSRYSISDVVVILGYGDQILKDKIGDGKNYGVTINYIKCADWKNGNGSSLFSAKEALRGKGRFLLSMADTWFEPEVIHDMISNTKEANILCVDKKIERIQNIEEATKVKLNSSGLIKEIGKDLSDFNAVDCGIFILSEDVFEALNKSFRKGDYSLSGAIRQLVHKGKVVTHDIGEYHWQDIDTEDDLHHANKKLMSSLRKEGDGLISKHLNRHLSLPITKKIVNYGISPDQITIASFLLSLLAGILFGLGTTITLVLAGVVTQLSSIVDGVDGEIARLKFASTKFGSYFDSILDRYGDTALIIGMAYSSYLSFPNISIVVVTSFALIGSAMSMMSKDSFFKTFGVRYDAGKMDGYGKYLLANRDGRLFLIFLAGITGQVFLVLVILAITTNLLAIYRLVNARRLAKSRHTLEDLNS